MTGRRKSDDEYRKDNSKKSTDRLIQEDRDRTPRKKPTRLIREELKKREVRLTEWND